ncbi:UDP-N-acetylglucosamine 2-epimerase [Brucella sp. IR073]|uniref:UDP-N-acetylglucosamine 2-epimerase n=1 Tax=unclassified Brucella TaxID=2632610 RepID=UPI003B986C1C
MALRDKRKVFLATTSRADFGIYQPVIAALRQSLDIEASLFVSGSHVPAEADEVDRARHVARLEEAAGIPAACVVPMPTGDGTAVDVAKAMGAVTAGSAEALEGNRPDLLVVLGDRYEMHAVAVAASALHIPIAHIHGGEESEGAIDNAYRHSMTKLSQLHFCATELSRRRIVAMGEEPWRVHVTGAPALDGLDTLELDERPQLLARLNLPDKPYFMATFHPETIDVNASIPAFEALIEALDRFKVTTIFSKANADEAGQAINARLEAHARHKPWIQIRDNLGRQGYFSAMSHSELLIGNSSSGIIEAASFGVPVVNVGRRQAGRERSANILDTSAQADDIHQAIVKATSPLFREEARLVKNVYYSGNASAIIRRVLEHVRLDMALMTKPFYLPETSGTA